jgi:hypothetical protein
MSDVRDRDVRNQLVAALSSKSEAQWSKRAQHDISQIPGLKTSVLRVELCNRIGSGMAIESKVHTNPYSGEPETIYEMKFKWEEIPLYVKCKFSKIEGREQLVIFSSHYDRGDL